MLIKKLADMYCGDSVRIDNGCETDMPIFGRFASIVRVDSIRVCEADDGSFYVSLPNGCSMSVDNWTEAEATTAAEAVLRNGWNGWVASREVARTDAIRSALLRHKSKASASAAYRAKFGT